MNSARDATNPHYNGMKSGFVVWLTGLSGAGKTTIARILEDEIRKKGSRVEVLDGDDMRKNLSPELGFSKQERELNAKKVSYVSQLLSRNGIITIVALISPYRSIRDHARNFIGKDFVEVWVKASIEICIQRDPKGIYKKAEGGLLSNVTGIQDPYEAPLNAELVVNTEKEGPEDSAQEVMRLLFKLSYLHTT